MQITDTIADLLTRIRNASSAKARLHTEGCTVRFHLQAAPGRALWRG